MSYSDEQIAAMFAKWDKNGDGFLSQEELLELLASTGIQHEKEHVDSFFKAVDTNKDNKISLGEFTHYIHFKTSNFKEINDLLEITATSISAIKKLDSMNFLNLGDEHQAEFKLHSSQVLHDNTLNTRFKVSISAGNEHKNEDLLSMLNCKLPVEYFFALKFHVTDIAKVHAGLPSIWAEAKEFLKELGPESAEVLTKTDVDFIECPDGVLMAFKAHDNCFLKHYIKMIEESSSNLRSISASAGFCFGSDIDLANYPNFTHEHFLQSNIFLDFFSKTINLANILSLPQIQKQITESQFPRDLPAVSSFFSLLSLKNVKLDIEADKNLKLKLLESINVPNIKGDLIKNELEKTKAAWKENPTAELMEAMEFLKNLLRLLHSSNTNSISLFVQCKGFLAGINLKGDVYNIINDFYPLN